MFEPPPQPREKEGIPVIIWLLIGFGSLGFVFFLLILAAIALPSFLSQANKAKQSEAKHFVAAMVRGEQAYFLEHETFTPSMAQLQLGMIPNSPNYEYALTLQSGEVPAIQITATPTQSGLKSYTGAVFVVPESNLELPTGQVCESAQATKTPPAMPTPPPTANAAIACPPGSHSIYGANEQF